MRQTDLSDLSVCAELSWKQRQELGIAPNQVLFPNSHHLILQVQRSNNGEDFAVSWGGILYACKQQKQFPGIQAYLRLVGHDGKQIFQDTILNYHTRMKGIPPRSGSEMYGPYHWVNENGEINTGVGSVRQYVNKAPWE